MDGKRFDGLAKGLATAHTRRSLLRTLAGATLATLTGLRHAATATAASPLGALCNRDSQCASGRCGPRDRAGRRRCLCSSPSQCPTAICRTPVCSAGGSCGLTTAADGTTCPGGACCNGACRNLQTDNTNCGACGNQCVAGRTCQTGACVCVPDLTDCGGQCVDTATDPLNCGGCGNSCRAGQTCETGVCTDICNPGFTECDGNCVNTATDRLNCGRCGNSCPEGKTCQAGVCASCPQGLTYCGGECVDTATHSLHCGACGRGCPINEHCVEGECQCGDYGRTLAPLTCCGIHSGMCRYGGGYSEPRLGGGCSLGVNECPASSTPCTGTITYPTADGPQPCSVCCPPRTTCDTVWGVCLQTG